MPTIVEKIMSAHSGGRPVRPGDVVDLTIDVRLARDFGGPGVVRNIEESGLGIADSKKTFFTFDWNPTGSDQKYAASQQACRVFARNHEIKVYDINSGIGTHIALDQGLVGPGDTLVSTDSHASILGAAGIFGQGMGEQDVAHAWAHGKVWFEVPPSVRVELTGTPRPGTSPKDIGLALLRHFGAAGLLGCAAEIYGEYVDKLSIDGRITIASLGTEMGAVIVFFPPNPAVYDYCRQKTGRDFSALQSDSDAVFQRTETVDITNLDPLISRPGRPEDVISVASAAGRKIDSAFIGSCTNGRLDDLRIAAEVLKGRRVAPGVVLKIVPATDAIWQEALKYGFIETFKQAGVLVGNAGCAGCSAGQIGQNGPGEVTLSSGNRNYAGKLGRGEVWLASPETVAASAVAGAITNPGAIPTRPALFKPKPLQKQSREFHATATPPPTTVEGRVWVIPRDNINTDMILHSRHSAVTDSREMGQHVFANLVGWEHFAKNVQPGDIIVTGQNFGAGSSRQQAVDCFKALKTGLIVARSFGTIYFRNAVNAGLPVMVADLLSTGIRDGERIRANLATGEVELLATGVKVAGRPFPAVQLDIYRRGGLLS